MITYSQPFLEGGEFKFASNEVQMVRHRNVYNEIIKYKQ